MLVTFIFSDLLWPDLDIFKYDIRTHAVPSLAYDIIFGEFEVFVASLTDPRVKTVKTVFLTFDLTVTLHMTLSLKC